MSRLEDILYADLQNTKIPLPERQVRIKGCRFVWDFGWRDLKVLVEVQGGIWMKRSAHNSGKGLTRDYRKNNWAVTHGWVCLFYSGDMVTEGVAYKELESYISKLKKDTYIP